MKKFQYQIIRYIHDSVTAEFVNVGIVIYQPETNFLQGKFITKFSRITQFFTEVNGQYLLNALKQFERQIDSCQKRLGLLFEEQSSLDKITNLILPNDDSALVCTEMRFGIDISPAAAIEDLFERLVDKYNIDPEKDAHDDKYVWKKVYKKYFDKYDVTEKLKSHVVQTKHDEINFDKAWKNGAWNCFLPLSFDLKRNDSIKNKVYKWSDILNNIDDSGEILNLYFLTIKPPRTNPINKFIEEKLLNRTKDGVKVKLVTAHDADKFVRELKQDIITHEQH